MSQWSVFAIHKCTYLCKPWTNISQNLHKACTNNMWNAGIELSLNFSLAQILSKLVIWGKNGSKRVFTSCSLTKLLHDPWQTPFFSLLSPYIAIPGKKKENYWVPKIKSLIDLADEIIPVTSLEWDRITEPHYTFFWNTKELVSPWTGNPMPL